MNLLVTGGAGYIGSHFCLMASRRGHKIVVFDNLSTGHRKFARFGKLIEADILDQTALESALSQNKIDAVVHFAGRSLVAESMQAPDIYFNNNSTGTLSVLRAMRKTSVNRLVLSSSAAVYGEPQTQPIPESTPHYPINPYGLSKLQAEQIARELSKAWGLKLAVLRYFNVIGQDPAGQLWEDHHPETHLVPRLVSAIRQKAPFFLFGDQFNTSDGTCLRDYVDVMDLSEVHLHALDYLTNHDFLLSNVGRGRGYSVLEVVRCVEEIMGERVNLEIKPPRHGDPASLVADDSFFKSWCLYSLRSLQTSVESLKSSPLARPMEEDRTLDYN